MQSEINNLNSLLIICISLSDQHARRALMTKQLNDIGMPFKIMDAIRPNPNQGWPEAYDQNLRLKYAPSDLRLGEIGCYQSHQKSWQLFLESDNKLCCILEDDVILHNDFLTSVKSLCATSDSWDLVRLYGIFPRSSKKLEHVYGDHYLVDYLVKQPNGTQGYIVNRGAAKTLLEHTSKMIYAIDEAIDREWEHRLRMRGLEPAILSQGDFASTIEKRVDNKKSFLGRLYREYFRMHSNLSKQAWSCRKRLRYFLHEIL